MTPSRCITGFGDVYLEADWSRFFGQLRPSQYPGAFPIAEGLTAELGFGLIVPTGKYDAIDANTQGLSLGSNTWDFAPLAAITYVTPPVLAEGTEFSAKVYVNNYLTNPDTNYKAGALINVDFAVIEHIGRLQLGLAGVYLTQIDDDRVNGLALPPDGRRATALSLGGIVAYDMPELGGSMKLKILTDVTADNFVHSHGVVFSFIKKLD